MNIIFIFFLPILKYFELINTSRIHRTKIDSALYRSIRIYAIFIMDLFISALIKKRSGLTIEKH